MTTEAYPLGYVAERHATENEVGDRFQHPPSLGKFLVQSTVPPD
jgi:hypothetical protein